MKHTGRMTGLGEAIERVLGKADPTGKRYGARAVVAWREVAGEEISRRTKGFALRENGELVVFVDSAPWAHQLSLMSTELIERLNSHLGRTEVRSIRFKVSRGVADEMRWQAAEQDAEGFYEPEETPPVPLSEREREQAAALVRPIRDPELREIALRVMIKDLEQKKGLRKRAGQNAETRPPGPGGEVL